MSFYTGGAQKYAEAIFFCFVQTGDPDSCPFLYQNFKNSCLGEFQIL